MGGGQFSEQHRSLISPHIFSAACASKTLPSWIFMSWWNEILSPAQINRGVGRLERSTSIQNMLSARRGSVLVKRRRSQPAVVARCRFVKSFNWSPHPPKVKNNEAKRFEKKKKRNKNQAAALQQCALEQLVSHVFIALHDAHRLLLLSFAFTNFRKCVSFEGRKRCNHARTVAFTRA